MTELRDGRFTETYHGFTIVGEREYPTPGDYQRWNFRVDRDHKPIFRYSTKVSGSQAVMLGGDEQADKLLCEVGKKRVHGKIDLGRYTENERDVHQLVAAAPEPVTLKKEEIRLHILEVVERIREQDPTRHKIVNFDVNGFCDILGIRYADYLSNAAYLREVGYVADSTIQQLTLDNGGIYITARGTEFLENQQKVAKEATVSADAEALRDQLLVILYAHEETGDSYYLASTAIAERIGLPDKTVRHHLSVLHRDGYIDVSKTLTDYSAILNTNGRQRVIEGYRHTTSPNVAGGASIIFNDSTVGMVNTGQVKNVKAISINISQLTNDSQSEVAEALKRITDFVTQNQEMASDQREELLDLLTDLSEQATLEPEKRMKMPSLRALVNGVVIGLGAAGSSADIWSTWGPAIKGFFGIA